jgi:DNA-binding SARP family transcriptional activator
VQVTALGQFSISFEGRRAAPWPRPTAKRLCQLVLLSPGRSIPRDLACEELFPKLEPKVAARAVSKALSMARQTLSRLGEPAASILQADAANIWARGDVPVTVDVEQQEAALKVALDTGPGQRRDEGLVAGLADEGVFLADEPYLDWALPARERLETLRQQARLALAQDRGRGFGRAGDVDVLRAWEACFGADPTCEEAARALMQSYSAQGRRSLGVATYERCLRALEDVGVQPSHALEEARRRTAASGNSVEDGAPREAPPQASRWEERRLVTVLAVELSAAEGLDRELDPDLLSDMIRAALAELVVVVESLGGTITSISATNVLSVFGAPKGHEDDPERALRAAFRLINTTGPGRDWLSLRAGVESGLAITGVLGGALGHYGVVGEVVRTTTVLQTAARPTSVLVGPAARRAAQGLFDWGPTEEVRTRAGARQLRASYLGRPRALPARGRRSLSLGRSSPTVGRQSELDVLDGALRTAMGGTGSVLALVAEPGLGKTRLVTECRRLFMAWVGAASGRLPLWLEGRAASYRSAQPYGLYSQLLADWVGTSPDEGSDVAVPALVRAVQAVFGREPNDEQLALLVHVMGLQPPGKPPHAARFGPEALQKDSFAAVCLLVSRLLAHGPAVLVLEDLHWADPTSLRLTEELAPLTRDGPLLLVLTYRPEPAAGVSTMETTLSTTRGLALVHLELGPLGIDAEEALAMDLLGGAARDNVVETVRRGAEGNPFFLEQRLSSLLETGALRKGDDGAWALQRDVRNELSPAIERLVGARIDRLGPLARETIVCASVLGVEFSVAALSGVTDHGVDLVPALAELCAVGLIVESNKTGERSYRFRHGIIQEATYNGLVKGHRQHLHARAASTLDSADRESTKEVAGVLGHHLAMAGEAARAAHYLELAGDHAVASFGNEEAVRYYRYALDQLMVNDIPQMENVAGVWFKLGQLFLRLQLYGDGRHALQEAGRLFPAAASARAADAYRLLSWVEVADRHRLAAAEALDTADKLLDGSRHKDADEWARTWIDVQLMRGFYHFYGDAGVLGSVLSRARPVVEARGTPKQKADFRTQLGYQRAGANRFLVDDEVIGYFRDAWRIVEEAGLADDIETNFVRAGVAYFLLIRGDVEAAWPDLDAVLSLSRRAGDRSWLTTAAPVMAWAQLRRGDAVAAREAAQECVTADFSVPFPFPEMARAVLAWVAWKEGRDGEVESLAREVLDDSGDEPPFPFGWICLWPLLSVRLGEGRTEEAMDAARQLLQPPQMRLPPELEGAVVRALAAWESGEAGVAAEKLRACVALARRLNFA